MNQVATFLVCLSFLFSSRALISQDAMLFLHDSIKSTMVKAAEWQLKHLPGRKLLGPDMGVFYTGLMAAYHCTSDEELLTAAIKMGETNQWKPGPKLMFPDHHMILNPYIELYKLKKDARMIEPAKQFVDAYLASPVNDIQNQMITWWLCDYAFMDSAVFVKLGRMLDRPELVAKNDQLWDECYNLLFDEQQNLFDVSPKNKFYKGFQGPNPGEREANGEKIFWGCGNGWVLGGLALMLNELPMDHHKRPFYEELFIRMARRLASLQQPSGTWGASLLDPRAYPSPESTGSGLLTYAFAYGVNAGLLPRNEFETVARKGWVGLNTVCLQPDFRIGWSEGSTAKPIRNFDHNSYSFFSAGVFLLAGSEVIKLAGVQP